MEYQRRLRDLREDHDKTQQEIADVLGTSQTMYARYERGANELPVRHLIKLRSITTSAPTICWAAATIPRKAAGRCKPRQRWEIRHNGHGCSKDGHAHIL